MSDATRHLAAAHTLAKHEPTRVSSEARDVFFANAVSEKEWAQRKEKRVGSEKREKSGLRYRG